MSANLVSFPRSEDRKSFSEKKGNNPPWKTKVMKTAKKVRKKTDLNIRVRKKTAASAASAEMKQKTKKGVKKSTKAKTVQNSVKKSCKKAAKPSPPDTVLTESEYNKFRKSAAKREQVHPDDLVTVDRRLETRDRSKCESENRERRHKVQRRRQIDPTTCERDYSLDEIEFMNALDEYKRASGRMFPTCSEILEVFRGLGYEKKSVEETVEVHANPETGNVFITSTEINTFSRNPDDVAPILR